MTESAAFVAAVLEGLDGAGAFADFLDEWGDPRGVLLRRRWKRWQKDRWAAVDAAAREAAAARATRWGRVKTLFRWLGVVPATKGANPAAVDDTFRRYLRRKFAAECPAVPKAPRRRRR